MKSVLLTGCAGFIGAECGRLLLDRGYAVVGVDNMNDYYDVRLKRHRLASLRQKPDFSFIEADIEDYDALEPLFADNDFAGILNLAARAGVRYSLVDPFVYERTNSQGTLNLLHLAQRYGAGRLLLASTSSLYAGQAMPFKESLPVNEPISPYAASKKAAEVMSYAYHFLYGLDVAVVRYFTVYGPAGRPDMSIFRFIRWIDEGTPLTIYGDGTQSRDFTYVTDIAEGTLRAFEMVSGYEVVNLGGNEPHRLNDAIGMIEQCLGKTAEREYKPAHKADMNATWADISKARSLLGWQPAVSLKEGIRRSVEWYRGHRELARAIEL